jgi:hypothetical protein
MNAFIQTLRYYFEVLLNSPHHLMVYVAAAAVLLIAIPLMRLALRTGSSEPADAVVAYPSMLGLNPPSNPIDTPPSPLIVRPAPAAEVTLINKSLTMPCIHCGATMSSRQDFCPACGYAQPMKQSFTA